MRNTNSNSSHGTHLSYGCNEGEGARFAAAIVHPSRLPKAEDSATRTLRTSSVTHKTGWNASPTDVLSPRAAVHSRAHQSPRAALEGYPSKASVHDRLPHRVSRANDERLDTDIRQTVRGWRGIRDIYIYYIYICTVWRCSQGG